MADECVCELRVIEYLAKTGCLSMSAVKQLLIVRFYPRFLARNNCSVRQAVFEMSEYYGFSERSIERLLYDNKEKFKTLRRFLSPVSLLP